MSIATKGPAGSEVLELEDGQGSALSTAATVRIRANAATGSAEVSAFGGAYAALGGGGGGGAIDVGASIFVDAVNGNDGTGQSGRQDRPFLTVGAALGVAASGDVVEVRPGSYVEQGLTVPAGVLLRGSGWTTTRIGDNAGTANILTMGAGSAIEGITAVVPAGAFAGIVHTAGTGSVFAVNVEGTGTTGLGFGIYKLGTGKLIGGSIRCEAGGLSSYLLVNSGVLALDDVHLPQSAGGIAAAVSVLNNGIFQCQGFNVGNSNCIDGVLLGGVGSPVARVYSPNIFNVQRAIHFAADGVDLTLMGGRIGNVALSVLVDPALTGAGSAARALGTVLPPNFSFPPVASGNVDFALLFNQEASNLRETRQRLIGGDLACGFPELGSAFSVGKGEPYSAGIKVVTSDSTATGATLGGNLLDVTTEAESRTGSTFTFQGTAAGHCIYVGSIRQDAASNPLKHWGHVFNQTTAAVLGGGEFVCEIWDGGAWVAVGVMAHNVGELYRYANDVFIRPDEEEAVQFGIDPTTTWAAQTILTTTAYWTRWRISTAVTTAPVFERVRLEESSSSFNRQGQFTARGLARWRSELFNVGNVWGEIQGGGAKDGDVPVGSGGAPTGWTQRIKKGRMDGNGDAISYQFQIPDGLCTAFPLEFELYYSTLGGSPITLGPRLILSALAFGGGGVEIADAAGGVVPVARASTAAEAFTSKAATAYTLTGPTGAIVGTQQRLTFGPFDIADYYEGDAVVLRVEMDDDGTPNQDVVVWSLGVRGVRFTQGRTL